MGFSFLRTYLGGLVGCKNVGPVPTWQTLKKKKKKSCKASSTKKQGTKMPRGAPPSGPRVWVTRPQEPPPSDWGRGIAFPWLRGSVEFIGFTTSPQMVVYVGNSPPTTLFQVGESL